MKRPGRSTGTVGGFVLLAALATGCFGPEVRPEPTPDAESLWSRAEGARLAGSHDEAADLYTTFYRFHYQDPRAGEALLDAGAEFRLAGRPERAREHFVAAAERKDSPISALAYLQLGYLERSEGQHAASAMRFGDAAQFAIDEETRAEALLEAGISLQKAGAFSEAHRPLAACVKLEEVAPKHAAEARIALAQEPFFTVQVGAFSQDSRAGDLVSRLAAAGFPAEIRAVTTNGNLLHRVSSGQFSRRPEADAYALRIGRELGLDAIVRP